MSWSSVDHVRAERYIPIIPTNNVGPVSLSSDNDLTICFVKPGCQGQKLPKEKKIKDHISKNHINCQLLTICQIMHFRRKLNYISGEN